MLDNMPEDLFWHWHAYSRLKPFGHQDRLLAEILVRLFNRSLIEGENPIERDDILPIARTKEEIMKKEEARMLREMGQK
jgi:hypothetical protein